MKKTIITTIGLSAVILTACQPRMVAETITLGTADQDIIEMTFERPADWDVVEKAEDFYQLVPDSEVNDDQEIGVIFSAPGTRSAQLLHRYPRCWDQVLDLFGKNNIEFTKRKKITDNSGTEWERAYYLKKIPGKDLDVEGGNFQRETEFTEQGIDQCYETDGYKITFFGIINLDGDYDQLEKVLDSVTVREISGKESSETESAITE